MIDADLISSLITVLISLLGAAGVGTPYLLGMRTKLNQARKLIVAIDDGFKDGKLQPEELKTIVQIAKRLIEDKK